MSNGEIIFKEDLEAKKKRGIFGWLSFGKKKTVVSSTSSVSATQGPTSPFQSAPFPPASTVPPIVSSREPSLPPLSSGSAMVSSPTGAGFSQNIAFSGVVTPLPMPEGPKGLEPTITSSTLPRQSFTPPVSATFSTPAEPIPTPISPVSDPTPEPDPVVLSQPPVVPEVADSQPTMPELPNVTESIPSEPVPLSTNPIREIADDHPVEPMLDSQPIEVPTSVTKLPEPAEPMRYDTSSWSIPPAAKPLQNSNRPEGAEVVLAVTPRNVSKAPEKQVASQGELLYRKGIATLRDLIAPPAIRLQANSMQVGEVVARTHFIIAYPKYLGTNWFSPIVNLDAPMDVSFFIHPIDTRDIVKDLRKAATQVQSQISIEAEEGKIRDPVLESALQNIEELRDKLQQGTEKFFRFGLYITIYAADEKTLNELSSSIEAILEAQLVFSKPAVLRMDQGFVSTRPLALDRLDVGNNLNTSPLSTTFPFVSSDLSSNEGVLYGINRHNNSLVLFDRFKMENANMVVFAKSGAGKSYTVKLEVLRAMMFGASVIIIDPENEYKHLCETVGGTFVNISLNSESHLNPFDLPHVGKGEHDEDGQGVFRSHIANLIGLLHLMLGSMTPEEDSILDRAIRETYAIRDITENAEFQSLTPSSFPTMMDLYQVLRNLEGAESLAARLERYTEGVFGGFLNNQTNISMKKQLIVFNIRDLEAELRPVAMYIVLQFIWNEIRSKMQRRMVVVDEAWIMMQHEDAAAFMFGIAKRCRKYYTGLTTITQDIGDFMASRYGKPIITNSSIQLLLKQSPASIELIAETFYLTDHEKFLLLESNVGEGIFFAGTKHVAIKIIASYSEDQIITTDPRQLLEVEEAKKEFDEGK